MSVNLDHLYEDLINSQGIGIVDTQFTPLFFHSLYTYYFKMINSERDYEFTCFSLHVRKSLAQTHIH